MASGLPSWPPAMTPQAEAELSHLAADYSLSHGLVTRPPVADEQVTPSLSSVIHAPVSLLPTPFPRDCFQLASELQPAYNALYAHVASSPEFLERIIGTVVAHVDDFTGQLYKIWRAVKDEETQQPWQLGLFRSDYLLHGEDGSELGIRQVEFNTVSTSFGSLSSRVTDLHRYLLSVSAYPKHAALGLSALPTNPVLESTASGLFAAHSAYLSGLAQPTASPPVVLMVTQPGERNAFDQRLLEYALLSQHSVRLVRVPLQDLSAAARLAGPENTLLLELPSESEPLRVSVVYYRAGYAPTDYHSTADWDTRLLLERSAAVKCPSVALQLAGAKKVQQVLSEAGELERFLGIGDGPGARLTREDAERLKSTWAKLYPLDDSELGKEGFRLASDPETAKDYVMKPQREGGGNNVYGAQIPGALEEMEARDAQRSGAAAGGPKEREGYILMRMIRPPTGLEALCLRATGTSGSPAAVRTEVISELGMYGACLFRSADGSGAEISVNDGRGHLLRTKASSSNEGGVAVGISCLDSPLLV